LIFFSVLWSTFSIPVFILQTQVYDEMIKKAYRLPVSIFIFIAIILSLLQLKMEMPIILLERFMNGGGWIEIFIIALYGAFIGYKIQNKNNSARWRRISWTIFSIVFFSQLALGLLGFEKFLMTGELHFPIPMMIMGGPLYRGELTIMTFLFLSTVILTGPAWCSQLCYFGALDNIAAQKTKPARGKIQNRATTVSQRILSGQKPQKKF